VRTLDVQRTSVTLLSVIQSFLCTETKAVFDGKKSRMFSNIRNVLERKLQMLDAAKLLQDLRAPPNNHLEALVKDRAGQHSIRINDQFRLCFVWTKLGPANVEAVDYH
jgi:proteic killer suppression protein